MSNSRDIFTTLTTEGALLPPDILQRIADGDESLAGLSPQAYHQYGRLNEATNFVWNRLQGFWRAFQTARAKLPEGDAGTSLTRERWLLPLFDLLGYGRLDYISSIEHEGQRFSISHQWRRVPINLMGCNNKLDERSKQGSPHSQVQVLLNRDDNFLWGFLSNGLHLRILRDNISLTRQAYIEFDLEAMMEGEVYSDFVLLYLLCHQSRVEAENPADYWLEQWRKTAEAQGKRALDELRDGVERAIIHLGTGFLEHPQNIALRDALQTGALDKQDYYRQLLRLVYRLLFLFVAEDRNLLHLPTTSDAQRRLYHFYSSQRLREISANLRGTRHHDLYESLRIVMQLLGGVRSGAEGLGLPVLGSFLFEDAAMSHIIAAQIANRDLLEAIRAISSIEDSSIRRLRRVDFKNLGGEELGSVYESLLELHPEIDNRHFRLTTAGGNERKTTGSYYTPTSLINALLDSALDPVLNEATRKGEDAILALKICDPACGSGHFLIAAANRMAKALAFVRTGEEEPTPSAIQEAKRDIISHCIYGVDINPMAVELCKVNLWMEALEPGKPLNFLDHRILVGNSLLGTTPKLMAGGIPDDAFSPIEGDDKAFVTQMKRVNKEERKQREAKVRQIGLFESVPPADYEYLTSAMHQLDATPDDTLEGIRRKEAQYRALANDPEYIKARLLADAWCAAFVWEKKIPSPPSKSPSQGERDSTSGGELPSDSERRAGDEGQGLMPLPMTDLLYRRMEENPLSDNLQTVRETVVELKERYQFFHWHVAFPDVFLPSPNPSQGERNLPPSPLGRRAGDEGEEDYNEQTGWHGGFDCVLGNPPWEHTEIKEKEWFSERAPDIANAAGATRKGLIVELANTDPHLFAAFQADLRQAEGFAHFTRTTGRYPLTARGRSNTYPLFAETSRHIINGYGRVGMIVPSGIATDDTTKFFFQDLMQTRSLASLYDFENREGLFPGVDSRMKFSLATMTGREVASPQAEFVFFALNVPELADDWRRFTLSADDIALLNPNTGTTATFRSQRDAQITKAIYRRVPVLIQEEPLENLWGITFKQGLFNMTSDSGLFRTRDELEARGYTLEGNRFVRGQEVFLPLYEGKMFMPYEHRFANVVITDNAFRAGQPELTSDRDKLRPDFMVTPRSWVIDREVKEKLTEHSFEWLFGFKNVTAPTNERTLLSTIFPKVAVGNSTPLLLFANQDISCVALVPNFSSFVLDYCVRQKMGNVNLNFYLVKQLPILPPHTYTQALLDFIVPRVLELTYTAWDLQPFAQDVGYDGAPFVWDEERRFLMRCELDALYFHLYQIQRGDVDYVMETFPIVKRKDEAKHGEYLTKRVILEMYDLMGQLPMMAVPTPKQPSPNLSQEGEGLKTYDVPNVGQWVTWLNPPPADASVAHGEVD